VFVVFIGFGEQDEGRRELKDYPYELREFAFIDINGYYIRVAEGIEKN
jgi:hypothetical protein